MYSLYQLVPTVPGGNASMSLNGVLSLHRMQECSMCSHRGRMGTRGNVIMNEIETILNEKESL